MPIPVQKTSRYNTWYRWLLSLGTGLFTTGSLMLITQMPTSWAQMLANNVTAQTVVGTLVSVAVTNGAIDFFNRVGAQATSTVDQAYQEAWILPTAEITGAPRYLVVQPHHKKRWVFGRDVIDGRRGFKILGLVDSMDEAQALCRAETHQPGMEKDVPRLLRRYPVAMRQVADYVLAYARLPREKAQEELTSIWRCVQHGTSSRYSAYRTLDTPNGRRVEFAPAPPEHLTTASAVSRYLRAHRLLTASDKALPRAVPDGGRLDDSPALALAWTVQSAQNTARIPWTLVPLPSIPSAPQRWVAACQTVTPDGRATWRFYPPWPQTVPHADSLIRTLTPALSPDGPQTVPVATDLPLINAVTHVWRQSFDRPFPERVAPSLRPNDPRLARRGGRIP